VSGGQKMADDKKVPEKRNVVEFDGEDLSQGEAEPNMSKEADSKLKSEVSDTNKQTKKQSKEDNAKFAEMRRQQEAQKQRETEMKNVEKEAYTKGVIEGIGGKNPYTKEQITDEVDLQQFQDMKTLESQGKDPITDYPAFLKEKKKQEMKLVKEQEVSQKKANEFIGEFETKYPGKFKQIWEDENFQDYADGKLNGSRTLVQIYEGYLALVGRKAEIIADRKVSKAIASPGSMTDTDMDVVSSTDWKNMSKDDFKKFVEKAKRGEFRK
jgi:hypothetical protein